MNDVKPIPIARAELLLWIWLGWTCIYGLYQVFESATGGSGDVTAQLEAIASIDPALVRRVTVLAYVLAGLSIAWLVVKIGAGKQWARRSLLITFVLEVLWVCVQPPTGLLAWAANVPDFSLQAWALFLVYTKPGRSWFENA